MGSKYDTLKRYLTDIPSNQNIVQLTFQEIAQLIGDNDLCQAAYNHRPWWANQTNYQNRPQAKAWMSAGWEVDEVKQTTNNAWVRFKRCFKNKPNAQKAISKNKTINISLKGSNTYFNKSYKLNGDKFHINGFEFTYVCNIIPEKDYSGNIKLFAPQRNYNNFNDLSLNKYGSGKFCRFRIPDNFTNSGVYIITVKDDPKYVGECTNLSSRYNTGYGQISPRNCFMRGQETNCRINKKILKASLDGYTTTLWFLQTERYKEIEQYLRNKFNWSWNKI